MKSNSRLVIFTRRFAASKKERALFVITVISLIALSSCSGIGGVGWDDEKETEIARQFPAIESNRISVSVEEVPFQTFKQEFDTVFLDFQYHGDPVGTYPGEFKTQIAGTPYSVSYEDFVLRVFRGGDVIAERRLPNVFYMHSISSGVILGKSPAEDRILCRTKSRATTGLHYVFIADGNGEILFEKVMKASEDWDILPGNSGEIIIGGARSKTIISDR